MKIHYFMKYTTKSIVKSRGEQATKLVSSSSALTDTLCDDKKTFDAELKNVWKSIEMMKVECERAARLAIFLLDTGCRISEALSLTYMNIDSLSRVRIEGKKGSNTRIFFSPKNSAWLLDVRVYKMNLWQDYNRFFIYRIFKKYGIGQTFRENKKMSITHYFRYLNAQIAKEIAERNSEISVLLGHKKEKNTEIYLQQKV